MIKLLRSLLQSVFPAAPVRQMRTVGAFPSYDPVRVQFERESG